MHQGASYRVTINKCWLPHVSLRNPNAGSVAQFFLLYLFGATLPISFFVPSSLQLRIQRLVGHKVGLFELFTGFALSCFNSDENACWIVAS